MDRRLIDEIQKDAVLSKTPLEDVLRKCLVLAAKLEHEPLRVWSRSELDGYESVNDLPSYRVVSVFIRQEGGPFVKDGSLIPPRYIPAEVKDIIQTVRLPQGIAELEARMNEGGIKYAIPEEVLDVAEAIGSTGALMVLRNSYRDLPSARLKVVLSTIRNRVLDFALSLEGLHAEAGADSGGLSPPAQELLDERFRVYVLGHGAVVNIAGNTAVMSNQQLQITPGDLSSLTAALADQGAGNSEIKELEAIVVESKPADIRNPKSDLRRWVARTAKTIAGGAGKLAEAGAKEFILLSLRYYFGEMTGGGGANTKAGS